MAGPGAFAPQLVRTRAGPPHRRFRPARVPELAEEPPYVPATDPDAVVVDDPGTELDEDGFPDGFPEQRSYSTAIPVKLPPELALYADLEYRHDEEECPCIVVTFKVDSLTGPPSAWLELCRLIAAITEQGPCMRCQRARGEAAHARKVG